MLPRAAPLVVALLAAACFAPTGTDATAGPSTSEATTTSTSATSTSLTEPTTSASTTTTTDSSTTTTTGPTTGHVDPTSTSTTSTTTETMSTGDIPVGCGDGTQSGDEQCDDGNTADDDGCSHLCQVEFCGDGIVQKNEECEDGKGCVNCTRTYFHVFVTNEAFTIAEIGSLDGADALCTQVANAVDLPGTYVAWLSTGAQPVASRLVHSTRPWQMPNGSQIAQHWEDLQDGSLAGPLVANELGDLVVGAAACGLCPVWTATTTDGLASSPNCADWADSDEMQLGGAGECSMSDKRWTESCPQLPCNSKAHLYCFEQPPP